MIDAAAHRRRLLAGVALVLLSAAAFSCSTVITKFAYSTGASLYTVVASRFLLGALLLWTLTLVWTLTLAKSRNPVAKTNSSSLPGFIVLGVLYLTSTALFLASLSRITAAMAALLLFTYPAMVAAAMLATRRDRFHLPRLIALAVALGGLILVVSGPAGTSDLLGLGLVLGAACCLAIYSVIAPGLVRASAALPASALIVTSAALLFGTAVAVRALLGIPIQLSGWPYLVVAGMFAGVGAPLYLGALDRLGSTRASIGGTSEPVLTGLVAALALGELVHPSQLLGGALVLAAVASLPLLGSPES